uniref:Uncharacterized protein n=1 Tax=Pygocentrus nattereri TaxID=42514 RepID=A0AAR2LHW2_PYGNA
MLLSSFSHAALARGLQTSNGQEESVIRASLWELFHKNHDRIQTKEKRNRR